MEDLAILNHFDRKFSGQIIDYAAENDPVLTEIKSLAKRFNMTSCRVREIGSRGYTVVHDPKCLNILVNFIGDDMNKIAKISKFSID